MLKLWRFIKGYVRFKCSDGFVERFINLCALNEINIWDIKCCDKVLTGYVSKRQSQMLFDLAKAAQTKLELSQPFGLPSFISDNKNRKGLLIGIILYFIIINVFSMFIWSVEIIGLDRVSEAEIRNSLSELGLHKGIMKSSINQSVKEQEAMEAIPDAAWISLNIHGTVLSVEISEREEIPDIIPSHIPCNVKAKYSGQIVRIGTKAGTAECAVGNAVVQGQVLISGIIENKFGGLSICHADGTVIANTKHKIETEIPMNYKIDVPLDDCVVREMADIMGFKATISPASSPIDKYYTIRKNDGLFIKDSNIPINITTEYMRVCEENTIKLDKETAKKNAKTLLELKKFFKLYDKKINGCSIKETTENGIFKLYAEYDCTENICYKEKLNVANDIKLSDSESDTNTDNNND